MFSPAATKSQSCDKLQVIMHAYWGSIDRLLFSMRKKKELQAAVLVVKREKRTNNTKSTFPFAPPPIFITSFMFPASSITSVPSLFSALLLFSTFSSRCQIVQCASAASSSSTPLSLLSESHCAVAAAAAAAAILAAAAALSRSPLPPATSYTSPHTRAFPFI